MRAVRIHAFGGPEVLTFEDVARPTIGDNDVLVKVHATSVNPVDRVIRAGYLQGMVDFTLPLVPGLDLAGVVEEVGSEVTSLAVGDEVYGYCNFMRQGAYAEYAIVTEAEVALKPKSLDFIAAAAVPLAGLSAWQSLEVSGLSAGQTILIHGAGGGVGTFAVQFARSREARVLATASTGKIELLKELGADEVIDYTTIRFEEVAHNVDVVLDGVGGEVMARSWAVLKPGGTLVTLVGQPDQALAEAHGARGVGVGTQPKGADLAKIAKLIDDGSVKPIVSSVFSLAEASDAHALLERGHMLGKVVLRVAG